MPRPAKQVAEQGGDNLSPQPSEPNLPDLTQEPYKTMVSIWKAQGQALCEVCGYQKNEAGCLWDPSHKE